MKLRVTNVARGLLVQIVNGKDEVETGMVLTWRSHMKEQSMLEIELEDKNVSKSV